MSENQNQSTPLKPEEKSSFPTDQLIVTHHKIKINEYELKYTVTAGTIVLKAEVEKKGEKENESQGEKPKATIFFVAYTLDDVADLTKRPITFSFNGGPGSSSVWLHLGLLGPKRVELNDQGFMLPPPFKLIDNEFSLLDITDLVFIDPVSTGFSRPVQGETAQQFHGFKYDIETVGDFIRLYTSRSKRWTSPKFLIGESYGTTRAGGLSGYLQERHGLFLNGIMLVSAVLNFSTLEFDPGNDLPYLLFLPTYTATAWYHKRLPEKYQLDLKQTLNEVENFVTNEYNQALFKGSALPSTERSRLIEKLSDYTGLSKNYLDQTNLRINIYRFVKELLRDEKRTVGRLDSRFIGIDRDAVGEFTEYDPSLSNIMGSYTAALNDYVRQELGFESDLPYEVLNPKVLPWNYSDFENRYVDVAETLRKAMTTNPFLKVFIANGYFDLATPYFATIYTYYHLNLDPTIKDHISMGFYDAGHMMYNQISSLKKLKHDLVEFIHSSIITS